MDGIEKRSLISLTLTVLASPIPIVELFRTVGFYPRIVLVITLTLFCVLIRRLIDELIATNMHEAK